jgi:hypothetical protein
MKRFLGVAALALAGAGTAALLAAGTASAWAYDNLPANCHTEGAPWDAATHEYVVNVRCDGQGTTIPYGTQAPPAAADDPNWQASLDAFVNAHYTAPATTTATATTTAAQTTTTNLAATTTTTTIAQSPTAPAPAPPTTTCDVQCQIDALQKQIDDLKTQVALMQRQLDLLIQLNARMPDADPVILAAILSTVQG